MRRFYLHRTEDISGNSGTGIVAWGVELPSGRAVMEWKAPYQSIAIYASVKDLEALHGHDRRTRVCFMDDDLDGAGLEE